MNIGIIFENWIFRLESNPFLRRMAHHCLPTELGLFQKEFNVTILVWFVSSSWKRKCTLLLASTNFTIMFFNLFFKTTNDQRAIVAMTATQNALEKFKYHTSRDHHSSKG
jgi:hypothetical protein